MICSLTSPLSTAPPSVKRMFLPSVAGGWTQCPARPPHHPDPVSGFGDTRDALRVGPQLAPARVRLPVRDRRDPAVASTSLTPLPDHVPAIGVPRPRRSTSAD